MALGCGLFLHLDSREFIDCRAQVFGIVLDRIDHAREDERKLDLGHRGRHFFLALWSQYFRTHGLVSVRQWTPQAMSASTLIARSDGALEPIFAGSFWHPGSCR